QRAVQPGLHQLGRGGRLGAGDDSGGDCAAAAGAGGSVGYGGFESTPGTGNRAMIPPSFNKELVAVAMSGGVDSSVVAAMLQESGAPIVGLTMQLWNQQRFP